MIVAIVVYCVLSSIYTDPVLVQPDSTPSYAAEQFVTPEVTTLPEPEPELNEADLTLLAKVTYGEAGCCSVTEQAAVIWCILNRVEDDQFPGTIQEVVTQPGHFVGYDPDHPVYLELVELARDVLIRWETDGEGRVLPKEYMFFHGDGKMNYFRTTFEKTGDYWDWCLPSPY